MRYVICLPYGNQCANREYLLFDITKINIKRKKHLGTNKQDDEMG